LGLFCFSFYDLVHKNYEQEILLEKISKIARSDINHVTILSGNNLDKNGPKKEIRDNAKIKAFRQLLNEVDKGTVGGHNSPIYECVLSFSIENNLSVCFLGTVYKKNPDDFFLNNDFYVKTGEGRYYRLAKKPVRIKNMGPWIIQNGPIEGRRGKQRGQTSKVENN